MHLKHTKHLQMKKNIMYNGEVIVVSQTIYISLLPVVHKWAHLKLKITTIKQQVRVKPGFFKFEILVRL